MSALTWPLNKCRRSHNDEQCVGPCMVTTCNLSAYLSTWQPNRAHEICGATRENYGGISEKNPRRAHPFPSLLPNPNPHHVSTLAFRIAASLLNLVRSPCAAPAPRPRRPPLAPAAAGSLLPPPRGVAWLPPRPTVLFPARGRRRFP